LEQSSGGSNPLFRTNENAKRLARVDPVTKKAGKNQKAGTSRLELPGPLHGHPRHHHQPLSQLALAIAYPQPRCLSLGREPCLGVTGTNTTACTARLTIPSDKPGPIPDPPKTNWLMINAVALRNQAPHSAIKAQRI
jgi:hypothetical protein